MTNKRFLASLLLAVFAVSAVAVEKELGKEYPLEDENQDIESILKLVKLGYANEKKNLEEKKIDKVRRDAHGKHHGCVRAKFQVLEDLPQEMRQGVFAYGDGEAPPSYTAWIRLSNGNAVVQPDWIPDGRGMAIKLVGVKNKGKVLISDEKETQDFVGINNPEFFIKNAKEYLAFMKDRANFFTTRPNEFRILRETAGKFITSPLEQQYFSMAPVSLGAAFMKYSMKPCEEKKTLKFGDLDITPVAKVLASIKDPKELEQHAADLKPFNDYLTATLAHQVGQGEVCYDFLVQLQKDADKHDVEDATSSWRDSEFHRVARITIEKANLAKVRGDEKFKVRDTFCENLALTPWHSVEALKPVGSIQRLRLPVYQVSSALRHEANGAELKEPTGKEEF